ncbi:cell division protein FtsQ/DivIB [Terrisporobacter mayombei]|uniref:Cell division protein DivIB n=1 Tax=Terrisporobacter mayombei TaxID=1541 RepID=A0ABY9Q365_9FIRM|nr:FtsQ-type POTRA domain-containing protein [Terrisporobacter mayombei]MCC3867367.1 FtsQ-type POTRA domain-containing protein [Terrisporobacter mayombei]WMT81626.1 Cell division protein DivIB [Terrisporobacter mayombei]
MKKRRKINTNKLMGILFFSLLLTLGTCFFLKSDFFFLKDVVINNNKYLSKEDVNNLLNLEKNKNIFFYDLQNLENRVKESAYVKDCEIKRKIPNKLIVNVKEKNIIGPLYNGKSYCYIDDQGKFVDELKEIANDELVISIAYTLNNKTLKFNNENDKNKLITLYKKLDEENILLQIKTVNFTKEKEIIMKGKTGLTICLNKDNNIEKNILKLSKVMIDLQNRKEHYGKVDFTYDNYLLYSPYSN